MKHSVKWIFNSLMVWGAVLGLFITEGCREIQQAWRHQRSGIVHYQDDEQEDSEEQFKMDTYEDGVLMLGLGLLLWVTVAKTAKGEG